MSQVDLQSLVQLQKQGNLAAAEAGYRQAIQDGIRHVAVYLNLGLICQATGRLTEALQCWESATEIDPGNVEALANLGTLLVSMGQFDRAIRYCQRALALNARHFRALNSLGNAYLKKKLADQAITSYRQALAIEPNYLTAQVNLAEALRESDQIEAAIPAYQRALQMAPDHEIARFGLEACQGVQRSSAPESYVRNLFDGYAETFDEHLVDVLEYRSPWQLADMLKNIAPGRVYSLGLDLGCGTGLSGEALKPICDTLDGVDLSQQMLDKAMGKGIYRSLTCADVPTFLKSSLEQYDLIVALDVFVYVGALEAVFQETARLGKPGAIFAFSVEDCDGDGFHLRHTGRYAHSTGYIQDLADRNAFTLLADSANILRKDRGSEIPGRLYIFQRG